MIRSPCLLQTSPHASRLAINCVFDSSTVSTIRSLLARNDDPVSVTSTIASASTKIQGKGLVVGTSNDWPYSFLDPKTNEWSGLDADILNMVAKMLKIAKITVQTVTFDGLIPGLLDGRFDIVGDFDPLHQESLEGGEIPLPQPRLRRGAGGAEGQPEKPASAWPTEGLHCRHAARYQLRGVAARHPWHQIPGLQGLGANHSGARDRAHRRGAYDLPVVAALMKEHPEWQIEMVADYEPRTFKTRGL